MAPSIPLSVHPAAKSNSLTKVEASEARTSKVYPSASRSANPLSVLVVVDPDADVTVSDRISTTPLAGSHWSAAVVTRLLMMISSGSSITMASISVKQSLPGLTLSVTLTQNVSPVELAGRLRIWLPVKSPSSPILMVTPL